MAGRGAPHILRQIVTLAGILALFNKPFLVIFDFGSPVHILARMGLGKLLPILVKAGFPVNEPTMGTTRPAQFPSSLLLEHVSA
jgi:hypothetical protein